MHTNLWSENLKGRDHLEDVGTDGRIILEWNLKMGVEKCGVDASGSGQGLVAGSCVHRNETSASIKGEEFLDWVTISFSRRTLLHAVKSSSSLRLVLILKHLFKYLF